jgi:hypothetical protein
MTTEIMKSIDIKNIEVLEILNRCKNLWYNDLEGFNSIARSSCPGVDREYYISNEHLDKIVREGNRHQGFPEASVHYNLRDAILRENTAENIYNKGALTKRYNDLNNKLQILLATKHNALGVVYPPGGFISWHNNANASAYNIIFTWSETGDGYWKHVDPHTSKQVVIKDVKGWQAKAFFFGSYIDDPNDLVYHMASTDCWRMTISYMFDREHKQFWEDIIEELELE